MSILYLLLPILLMNGLPQSGDLISYEQSHSRIETFEGILRLYGNEPFTQVALVTDDEKRYYLLMNDDEMDRLWSEQRGRIRITGRVIERIHLGNPADFIEVESNEWIDEETTSEWMDEDTTIDADKNRMLGIGLIIMLIPGSIFLYIYFYRTYGREYKPKADAWKIRYSPPNDIPPAMVRKLMAGPRFSGPDKLALGISLFDLSRRGYFRIVEKSGDQKFLGSKNSDYYLEKTGKKPDNTLKTWEFMLWDRINQRINAGVIRIDKILDLSTKTGRKWWKQWRKEFRNEIRETVWFDPAGNKPVIFHAAAQLPFLFGSILTIYLIGAAGVIALTIILIMMLLSLTLRRYSHSGKESFAAWSGYRKSLRKGSGPLFKQEDAGLHFVYAIALGLSQKQIEKCLQDVHPDNQLFFWIVPMSGTFNMADIASGLSRMELKVVKSFSGLT